MVLLECYIYLCIAMYKKKNFWLSHIPFLQYHRWPLDESAYTGIITQPGCCLMIGELAAVSGVSVEGKVSIRRQQQANWTAAVQTEILVSEFKGRRATQQEVKTLVYGTKQEAFARHTLKILGFQHGHTNSCQFIAQLRLKVNSGAKTQMMRGANWWVETSSRSSMEKVGVSVRTPCTA